MATTAARRLTRDQVIWAFGPDLEPVIAEPGDPLVAEKPAPGFGTIARFSIPKIEACPRPFA
jgi:hypothetical protein